MYAVKVLRPLAAGEEPEIVGFAESRAALQYGTPLRLHPSTGSAASFGTFLVDVLFVEMS
jgi:hypothetical protein